MIRNDYIIRLVERFSLVIAKIITGRQKGAIKEAAMDIRKACSEFIGIDFDFVKKVELSGFLDILKANEDLYNSKCIILAELLREDVRITRQAKNEPSPETVHKCLFLFLEVFISKDKIHMKRAGKNIREMIKEINIVDLPCNSGFKLLRYFEINEQYARAEDILFHLAGKNKDEAYKHGIEFYDRLLGKADSNLEKGGLPRSEVEEGLKEFKALFI